MANLHRLIGSGQHENRRYGIWSIWDKNHELLYWYMVIYEDCFKTEADYANVHKHIDGNQVYIRQLPNYREPVIEDLFFRPEKAVVSIIKEAVRKGDIVPMSEIE